MRPTRADAQRNREKLLVAARRLFAANGADVPLAAVAKEAGVGVGTAYRHFPTPEALVDAAYRDEVARLLESAREVQHDRPPDEAFEEWLFRFLDYMATKRGMADALQRIVSGVSAEVRDDVVGALAALLHNAQAAGSIRDDVDAEDVMAALVAVWAIRDDPPKAQRILALILDGLKTDPGG